MIKFIQGLPQIKPMVISVWCGESKPNDLSEYLDLFVTELDFLLSNGIYINGKRIIILLRCFICDTPARSFIKGNLKVNINRRTILTGIFSKLL